MCTGNRGGNSEQERRKLSKSAEFR